MKEAFRLIYGKEWKWFLSLALAMKLRLIWFLVSFVMLCALSFDRSDVLCVVAFIMNFLASAIALRGVSGDGIEE
ncbi:MAG: hypothetical protein JJO71_18925 [Escherichia coli]|nr:hypothetical protein [Escherichia coli]